MIQPVMAPRVMVPSRQGRDQKTPPAGDAIVAQILAGNLGSSPEFLAAQKIDERKFAFLNDLTATALGYFGYRGYKDKVGFWAWCVDWELTSSVGINGMGRRHILAALLNARGETCRKLWAARISFLGICGTAGGKRTRTDREI